MQHQRVPDEWGNVSALMIYKKGEDINPDNYRCMSLISNITKIFASLFNNRLLLVIGLKAIIYFPSTRQAFAERKATLITSIH